MLKREAREILGLEGDADLRTVVATACTTSASTSR